LALGKALIALGKGFAECRPRQTPHGNQRLGKAEFAECFFIGHLTNPLPSAELALGRKKLGATAINSNGGRFAECLDQGTRQRIKVCRVPQL